MEKTIITVGKFDGQHFGHQRLFSMVRERAKDTGFKPMALSFFPDPALFFGKGARLITSYDERRDNIGRAGFLSFASAHPWDPPQNLGFSREISEEFWGRGHGSFVELPFSIEFSQKSPEEFMMYLAKELNCAEVVVGDDYRFGKDRTGSFEDYREYAVELGMEVQTAPTVEIDGIRVSSSAIRGFVEEKNFEMARRFMGRKFAVHGIVTDIAGNYLIIQAPDEKLLPPDGEYRFEFREQRVNGRYIELFELGAEKLEFQVGSGVVVWFG